MSLVTQGLGAYMAGASSPVAGLTKEQALNTIQSEFNTRVTIGESLPTQWPNAVLNPPDDSEWCRVDVMFGEDLQVSIGSSTHRFRTPGIMQVRLFSPVDKGQKTVIGFADTIESEFRVVSYNGVVFRTPRTAVHGRKDRWWEVAVSCPFYFDKIA